MDNTNFEINGIIVSKPTKNKEGWYSIKQQSFTIDKKQFLLEEFNKEFPNFKVSDYKLLEDVITRSSVLKTWYTAASLRYVDTIQLPVSLKNKINPDKYQEYFNDLQSIKTNLSEMSAEIEVVSDKFRNTISSIKNNYEQKISEIKRKNKIYSILTLNKEDLPLTLQFEVSGYSPKVDDVVKERVSYASELLIEYQRSLIDLLEKEPNIDIDSVIDNNRTK